MALVNYTLFYNAEDGKMYAGTCREEKEVLVDVSIGNAVELEGYHGDGLTLTLTGLNFQTTADIALVVPEQTTIILESGESRLSVYPKDQQANVAVLYAAGDMTIKGGDGKLVCDASNTREENCSWSRGICVRYGDLTICGGDVEVYCGLCSRRAGAFYAGGRLYGGDRQKGAITITGGTIVGTSVHNVIRATEGRLTLGAGAQVENSNECSGGNEAWQGSFINQADQSKPLKITFRP